MPRHFEMPALNSQPRDKGANELTTTARLPVKITYDMVDGQPVIRTVRLVCEQEEGMFVDAGALFADIGADKGQTIARDEVVRIQIAHQQGTLEC